MFLALCLLAVGAAVTGAVPDTDMVEMSKASVKFSQDIYNQLVKKNEKDRNLIFSPFSAHASLSMLYLGIKGDAATEMRSVLHLTKVLHPHTTYQTIIRDYNTVHDVNMNLVNGVWVKPSVQLIPDYQTDVKNYYNALADTMDITSPAGPETPINDWIANTTDGQIKDFLAPETINEHTILMLINALLFNGTWETPFDPKKTSKQAFFVDDGYGVLASVDMMFLAKQLESKTDKYLDVDVVKLPFQNTRFAMYFAVPRSLTGMTAFEGLLRRDGNKFNNLFTDLKPKMISFYIPKFTVTTLVDLEYPLKAIGLKKVFSSKADFSGMTKLRVGASHMLHMAKMEVNEQGAFASGGASTEVSWKMAPKDSYLVKANHSFMFFIRDDVTGQILFRGKFANPIHS
ncbi:serine protease inhibitor 42Dd-like [Physella acuta]|uniref:serine protease inhibitor 42Dd-like n=1 Tax=Physella acuta TaxID=109671 RepID=UPI0027DADB6D|nr:serine protease inhibitor 42Dd-like [Physella acuta]